MSVHGDHEHGAAWRRRQLRLRMHWRHEQLTLQMALAAALHRGRDVGPVTNNALRSQRTARAAVWGARVELHGPAWTRLDRIAILSRPQERTVQQIVDAVPSVQILDAPVPQTVEQLVEVPTIVSYSLLQLIMEQNVDIPVPGCGGRNVGLQCFLPGLSSTAPQFSEERTSERIVEQIVFPSSEERISERIVVFPGGFQNFRPGQSSSSSSHFPVGFP